jgi:hypothetical protein
MGRYRATREETKEFAQKLMEAIRLGDKFINDLRDDDKVGMSEQHLKERPEVFSGEISQPRTYFDSEGGMYDVYPYMFGMKECDEAPAWFEEKYPGYYVYHMNYARTFLGEQVTLFYVTDHDDGRAEDDEEADVTECWNKILDFAQQPGLLPAYIKVLGNEAYSGFGEVAFCTTDNGCMMRMS